MCKMIISEGQKYIWPRYIFSYPTQQKSCGLLDQAWKKCTLQNISYTTVHVILDFDMLDKCTMLDDILEDRAYFYIT